MSKYDTAEGEAYFESMTAFSRLTDQLWRLQTQQQHQQAVQLIDQFFEEHPQSEYLPRLKRTRRVLLAELD